MHTRRFFLAIVVAIVCAAGTVRVNANESLVVVEEASVVPGPGRSARAFLVINNRSTDWITLTSITSPLVETITLVRSTGSPLPGGATVPAHAELYMQPNTLYVALAGVSADMSPGQTLPLTLTLRGGLTAGVVARVVADEVSLPDHHDFQH